MSDTTAVIRHGTIAPAMDGAGWHVAVALCIAALTIPLLLVEVPPILDYPNHLARLWILAVGQSDPVVSTFAEARWAILPNLGVDILVPPLIRLLPVHLAGRLMLAGLEVTLFAGCLAYSRALLGYRSGWALGSALIACNGAFLMGFLNFSLGLGLALLFAAHWLRHREHRPGATLAMAIPGAIALFFCHMAGLFFFLLLVGCREFAMAWDRRPVVLVRGLAWRAAFVLPVLVAPAVLYLLSPLEALDDPPSWSAWSDKVLRATFPMFGYNGWLDVAAAAAILGLLGILAVSRRLLVPLPARLALGVLVALYVVAPFTMKGVSYFDTRFAVMAWILVFAGLTPVRLARWPRQMLALAVALLVVARVGGIAWVWHGYGTELADLRAIMIPIRPADRVLVAAVFPDDAPAYFAQGRQSRWLPDGSATNGHCSALALIERKAFWPPLFANPTQQPVRYLPPFDAIADATGAVPSARMLSANDLAEDERMWFPIWDRWWRYFDWVLLEDPAAVPDLAKVGGGHLDLVAVNPAAALFRVRR